LKGAPPTFSFLKSYIKFIGENYSKVITGLVFEWEDTFPYDGYLEPLRGPNIYTKEQVKEILELTKEFKFKVVPLV
jgi:hypothetical protein